MEQNMLRFEQYDDDLVNGAFVPPESETWDSLQEGFYDLEDYTEYQDEYVDGLLGIINKEPTFLDAYAHIGGEYLDSGDIAEAEKYYLKGLDIALALIPDDFKGTIPWVVLDNRPFLRLHHGYILCHLKKENLKDAIKLMDQHLIWNPNDNIGVRFLVEDACRQAGMTQIGRAHV